MPRRTIAIQLAAALLAAMLTLPSTPSRAADPPAAPLIDSDTWDALRPDVTGEAAIAPADGLFTVDAPYRAEDAATVPIHVIQTDPSVLIERAMVVIDENPAPVAGSFTFSPAMAPLDFELRVRVNAYSNVRVIAETPDGLRMDGHYVKASGGCSAPASKAGADALAGLGQMRLRLFGPAPSPEQSQARREAQIQIRHPNFSGLQRDQITQLFIPAHFIDHLEVWQGEELLFAMDGGISISENPAFRFTYADNGVPALTVRATDTEGNAFETVLPKAGG